MKQSGGRGPATRDVFSSADPRPYPPTLSPDPYSELRLREAGSAGILPANEPQGESILRAPALMAGGTPALPAISGLTQSQTAIF